MAKCVKCKINNIKNTKKYSYCLKKELIFTITNNKIISTNWDLIENGEIL